jgi:hypothetical protein
MRFVITAHPNPNQPPAAEEDFDPELFTAYMKFNEDMHRAGVLIASEGLNPGSRGGHVVVRDGKRVALDGPFAETKELVGGFYLIEVPTLEDALGWAKRCPVGMAAADVLEVWPLTGLSDLPPALQEMIVSAAPTWSASFAGPR